MELTLLVLQKTHHNQSRGRPTHDISLKVVADRCTLHLLKVVADPRTLYLTQSRGRPTHHTSPFKVVADLQTQIHGTLRPNKIAISDINDNVKYIW